jgi:uncharacterized membrane protein YvlD (DUF360 family)
VSLLQPIRDTMGTSLGLARERVGSGGRRRLLLDWTVQAIALLLVAQVVPGISVSSPLSAFIAALVLGLLNALVRPVLIVITLPLTVVTVGLLSLLINAGMLSIAAPLVPGLEVDSVASAIVAAVLLTLVTTTVSVVLASDQDATFYAELARRISLRDRPRIPGGQGLVIVQVDGLAAPILRNAIRVGITPRMAGWVRSGRYRLVEWDCAPPSQTSASQAGILHGNNTDIPAFRWFEKERGAMMVSNRPKDAAEIERRLSDGRGLLSAGGTSIGNLFSGDAERNLFTMSRIGGGRAADVDAFSLYFVDPAAFIRTVVLTIGELLKEFVEARRQRSLDIQPRIHRGGAFPILRAVSNVLLRDLNVTFLLNSMSRGTPIVYVDFVDYDELAHHAGPERLESLRSLAGVDRVLASIERAAASAPRDYRIVVLSDHGQSQGATFLQRYGATLEDVIRGLMGGRARTVSGATDGEGWGPVNALLGEIRRRPGIAGRVASSALEGKTVDGAVDLGADQEADKAAVEQADLIVCASGNLANAYFPVEEGRLTLEAIEAHYPGLVQGLVAHPGIGFLMARSASLGAVAIGAQGVHLLDGDRVDGVDPLLPFGPRAADHLRRLDSFTHVGDLLINSTYDADLEEVAAFEELVGSHGGFGGPQVRPFLLAPADLPFEDELVGAPAVYHQLVAWADAMGVGPGSGASASEEESTAPGPRARGIGLVAAYLVFVGAFLALIGTLAVVAEVYVGALEPVAPGVMLLGIGSVAVGLGLWRRKGWAWLASLVLEGVNVIALLLAAAESGLSGIAGFGAIPAVLSLAFFYYLTRPHVAAEFGHHPARVAPRTE